MDQRADKRFRITRRKDISQLFAKGRRVADGLLTIFAMPNEQHADRSRMVVAVSSRHGNAVRRNRIKRLCREAFRKVRSALPTGWDFAVVPRIGQDFTVEKLKDSIRSLARQASMKDRDDTP